MFSKYAGRSFCVYLYINIAWLKSTRSLIFRILYLRKRGSLWDIVKQKQTKVSGFSKTFRGLSK